MYPADTFYPYLRIRSIQVREKYPMIKFRFCIIAGEIKEIKIVFFHGPTWRAFPSAIPENRTIMKKYPMQLTNKPQGYWPL